MRNHHRASAVCVLTAMLLLPRASAAAERLVVRTYDTMGLAATETTIARGEASAILKDAGFGLEWRDCSVGCIDPLGPQEILVRIVTAPAGAPPRSLGYAVVDLERRRGALATVYADRITSIARRTDADAGRLIGRAIAHEIAHLLLGTARHSADGLMRARWSDQEVRNDFVPDWTLSPQDIARLGRGPRRPAFDSDSEGRQTRRRVTSRTTTMSRRMPSPPLG